jgi:hypothetical protein
MLLLILPMCYMTGPLARAEVLGTTGTTHHRKLQAAAVDLTGATVSGVMTVAGLAPNLFTWLWRSDELYNNKFMENLPGCVFGQGASDVVIGPSTCECTANMNCSTRIPCELMAKHLAQLVQLSS